MSSDVSYRIFTEQDLHAVVSTMEEGAAEALEL